MLQLPGPLAAAHQREVNVENVQRRVSREAAGEKLLKPLESKGINVHCHFFLTANVRGKVSHFIIQRDEFMQYRFEGDAFPDVVSLIQHYVVSGLAITERSQAKIRNPVFRPGFTPTE